MAQAIGNVGALYVSKAKTTKDPFEKNQFFTIALDNYKKSLTMLEDLRAKREVCQNLSQIGSLYINIGQALPVSQRKEKYRQAEIYLFKTVAICDTIGAQDLLVLAENYLSALYELTGDWKNAMLHYKKYISVRDSVFSHETTKKSVQTEMNYDFEKKEQASRLEQEKKDVISKQEKQKQTIIIISISIGLILVIILAIVIFRSLRQNQKKNKIITEQKLLVEHQKEKLEEKQTEILDSIRYAKRIQTALITSEKYITKNLDKLIDRV